MSNSTEMGRPSTSRVWVEHRKTGDRLHTTQFRKARRMDSRSKPVGKKDVRK